MEHKLFSLEGAELKFSNTKTGYFAGYASKYGNVDSYGDTIAPGAYKTTIANRNSPIQLRWNHRGPIIGKWLSAVEDEKGLWVEGELTPGHSVADDVYASMKHGAVTGLSIGYRVPEGGSEKSADGGRLIKAIELVEISIVESPADAYAQIASVKSALEDCVALKDIESLLRDAGGFSRADACALVARIKSMGLSDSAPEKKVSFARLLALQASIVTLA